MSFALFHKVSPATSCSVDTSSRAGEEIQVHKLGPLPSGALGRRCSHEHLGVSLEVGKLLASPGPRDSRRQPVRCLRNHPTSGARGLRGISSQVLPSRRRPPALGVRPPHCLKKNGTFAEAHWSRRSITQASSIWRARGPLSPPAIRQW